MDLKVIEKSRKLLVQCMGQEDFDKFIEDGKIQITHKDVKEKDVDKKDKKDEITYELDQDARIYNRTRNQFYCVEPICPDSLPIHDQLAIKYSYLRNNINRIEEVANKRDLTVQFASRRVDRVDIDDIPIGNVRQREYTGRYAEYANYMEERGWRRQQIVVDENNNNLVVRENVRDGETGNFFTIRVPAGNKITIMGLNQVENPREAHTLRLRCSDNEDEEISYMTQIRITKESTSGSIVQIARLYYGDISITRLNPVSGMTRILKTDDDWYRFRNGIEINGEQRLVFTAINCRGNIMDCRFGLDCDFWVIGD